MEIWYTKPLVWMVIQKSRDKNSDGLISVNGWHGAPGQRYLSMVHEPARREKEKEEGLEHRIIEWKRPRGPKEVPAHTPACRGLALPLSVNLYYKRGLKKDSTEDRVFKKQTEISRFALIKCTHIILYRKKTKYVGVFCSPTISLGCL